MKVSVNIHTPVSSLDFNDDDDDENNNNQNLLGSKLEISFNQQMLVASSQAS